MSLRTDLPELIGSATAQPALRPIIAAATKWLPELAFVQDFSVGCDPGTVWSEGADPCAAVLRFDAEAMCCLPQAKLARERSHCNPR